MTKTLIGYARCSTDKQDLTAQQSALIELGVAADRIYTDHGLTGTNRSRPGLDQALAAVRLGDTLVVPKLDRLARSVPDARYIADFLIARGGTLASGTNVYDPTDPMGKMFFNILDLRGVRSGPHPNAHTGGNGHCRGEGETAWKATQALEQAAARITTGCTTPGTYFDQ